MIRLDIKEDGEQYWTAMMEAEMTQFIGREPYVTDCR